MNLALNHTKTSIERTYEVSLPGRSNPYRKAMNLIVRLTTINGEYIRHTIDDPNERATAIEHLEIGAEVLKILKEDEAPKEDVAPQINIVSEPAASYAKDCPF